MYCAIMYCTRCPVPARIEDTAAVANPNTALGYNNTLLIMAVKNPRPRVRSELFCDGTVNCAVASSVPAGEEISSGLLY